MAGGLKTKKRSPDCTTSGDAGSRKGELVEEEETKTKKKKGIDEDGRRSRTKKEGRRKEESRW